MLLILNFTFSSPVIVAGNKIAGYYLAKLAKAL